MVTNQAPQMKYCRNIIAESRVRTSVMRRQVQVARVKCPAGLFGKDADADVAEGDGVAVVLQGDVAATGAGVAGHLPELAGGDALLPLGATQLVFQQLFA